MNRLSLLSLMLVSVFTGCGEAHFSGTYAATGETVWEVFFNGERGHRTFPVANEVPVQLAGGSSDFEITVDGCTVELRLRDRDTAAVVPGKVCTYILDGDRFAEVYEAGTMTVNGQDRTASYFAIGTLATVSSDGTLHDFGRFRVSTEMVRTSDDVGGYHLGPRDLEALRTTLSSLNRSDR